MQEIKKNMHSRNELFMRSLECNFWHSFPSLLCNSGNKHQNNTLVSAWTVRHSSTYIILYVVGPAPTGDDPAISEWSMSLLPNKVWLILKVWQYSLSIRFIYDVGSNEATTYVNIQTKIQQNNTHIHIYWSLPHAVLQTGQIPWNNI